MILNLADLKLKKSKHFVGIRPEHLKANQNTKFNLILK